VADFIPSAMGKENTTRYARDPILTASGGFAAVMVGDTTAGRNISCQFLSVF